MRAHNRGSVLSKCCLFNTIGNSCPGWGWGDDKVEHEVEHEERDDDEESSLRTRVSCPNAACLTQLEIGAEGDDENSNDNKAPNASCWTELKIGAIMLGNGDEDKSEHGLRIKSKSPKLNVNQSTWGKYRHQLLPLSKYLSFWFWPLYKQMNPWNPWRFFNSE